MKTNRAKATCRLETLTFARQQHLGDSHITNGNRTRSTALHAWVSVCGRSGMPMTETGHPATRNKGFTCKTTASLIRTCVSNTVPCRVDIKVYALRCTPAPLFPPYTREQDFYLNTRSALRLICHPWHGVNPPMYDLVSRFETSIVFCDRISVL